MTVYLTIFPVKDLVREASPPGVDRHLNCLTASSVGSGARTEESVNMRRYIGFQVGGLDIEDDH